MIPLPLPFSRMPTDVTAAPSAGVPVQPVIPVNCVRPVVPVYEQVPVAPATVNFPVSRKGVVVATVSVPPARFWPAPSTVVFAFPAEASRSSVFPFRVAPSSSMLAPSPSSVVSTPSSSVPSSAVAALKVTLPLPTSTVTPESILIVSVLTVRVVPGAR